MVEISIDQIKPSPYQPRLNFEIDDLKKEIERDGLLSNLVVRRRDGFYELIDGQRRWLTLKELGWKTVPVEIRDVDDGTARRSTYKLNKIRENYTVEEEARFFQKLAEEGLKPYEIEVELGVDHHWVNACLNIWEFPEDIREHVFGLGALPKYLHMRDIQHLEPVINRSLEQAIEIARQIIKERLTADEKRELITGRVRKVDEARLKAVEEALPKIEPEVAKLETSEELEAAAKALRKEAKKRRVLTPEQKAMVEAEKSRKKEEKCKREQEKKKREEEELSKRLEAEKKRIEEEAKKKAKEELSSDTEFLKQAAKKVPFILAEEELAEMQVELPSAFTQELLPSKPVDEETNKLNTLSGNEWIKFTKTWFIHNPPPRKLGELLHPAKFPETLIAEFIEFFTKPGQIVLDPLLGTGSTLVACDVTGRIGIGVELEEKWAKIAKTRTKQTVILGDVRDIDKMKIPKVDFVITSPPYWNQLKRASIRQKERSDLGIPTEYSEDTRNIGNIDDYNRFIEEQKRIFEKVYDLVKAGGYLVIITNNVFFEGRLYPLAFDTATSLSRNGRWVLKDEKIWLQDNKELLPLGIYNAWVGNRCHEYCLIFRKES